MKRNATAVWNGALKAGKGQLSTDSGVLKNTPYSFAQRFESAAGTNPEELIAAAHAGCFSMAFSGKLEAAGMTNPEIRTTGTITIEKGDTGWSVKGSHLNVKVKVPGGDRRKVEEAAKAAKETCPVSRTLAVPITMDLEVAT